MFTRASRLVTVVLTMPLMVSISATASAAGAAKLPSTETGATEAPGV